MKSGGSKEGGFNKVDAKHENLHSLKQIGKFQPILEMQSCDRETKLMKCVQTFAVILASRCFGHWTLQFCVSVLKNLQHSDKFFIMPACILYNSSLLKQNLLCRNNFLLLHKLSSLVCV